MDSTPNQKTINEKELETLAFWKENSIFEKSVATPASDIPNGTFTFYDGPPFATGMPHHGHILAGSIKDAIPRYQTMKGKRVRRVWGWDCHGLPVENLVEKELGLSSKKEIEEYGIDKFNKKAQESVLAYESEWKKIIPRLGRFVDMDHAYKTMDATYTESIWWAWSELYKKGLAYEGHKMMHICPRCETPLAQSEVGLEYHDITDLSVAAKFELTDEKGTYILAWTTTPWTLPGNTALAINTSLTYVKIKSVTDEGVQYFILAKSRVGEYFKDATSFEIVEEFTGESLVGKTYTPVFSYFNNPSAFAGFGATKENIWKIWHADFITDDAGTGIAHQAPAFGEDDMNLAKACGFPVIKHVNMDGTFTKEVTDFPSDLKVKKKDDSMSADIEIVKWLAHNGKLFEKHKIIHSYPLCWRCKTPLLNYATSSWFVDVPKMKDKLLSENKKVGWTPEHVRDGRFGKWLEGAREWAVSRTRFWGAPLPIWKNKEGVIKVIGSLEELAQHSTQKPKNTYYVVRHGESQSNVEQKIDCSGDPKNGLTEKGRSEVFTAVKTFEGKVDVIIASPLVRTKETAEIFSQVFGDVEVIFDERLKELDLGKYDACSMSEYQEALSGKSRTIDEEIEGVETHRALRDRVMQAWLSLEETYEGKSVLIVTHAAPALMLLSGVSATSDQKINEAFQSLDSKNWLLNAEVRKLEPVMVPRDETGNINLHRPYIDNVVLSIDGEEYTRIPDVFDCWFESGSMPFAQLHYPFENKDIFEANFPADFIAEGVDQTRGWFYSLMNLGVGLFDKSPYKHVIVNGLVLSDKGVKLSKSDKNFTDPITLVEKYGADAVRYFLLSSPAVKGESVQFSDKGVEEVYKKNNSRLENVLSLYEMNVPETIEKTYTKESVLDLWIVSRLHEVIEHVTKGYDAYLLDEAVRPIDAFIDDLSVWYIRRSRDRLKGDLGEEEKRQAYATLSYVLREFAKVLAPVMPFIAERVYKTGRGEKESVHLESWPVGGEIETSVIEEMSLVRGVVTSGLFERTQAKIGVRQPLQSITLSVAVPKKYHELILDELNIKEIIHDATLQSECVLDTALTETLQREGDIRNVMRAIQDARKKAFLQPKDSIDLTISIILSDDEVSLIKTVCNVAIVKVEKDLKGDSDQEVAVSFGSVVFSFV